MQRMLDYKGRWARRAFGGWFWGLFGGFRDLALWGSLVLWSFLAGFVVCSVFGLLAFLAFP
jgi:hypothetical protein